MSHRLSAMEFALAREAAAVGRVFALAGVPFDSRTFVGMRLLEASVVESIEPTDVLRVLDERGALDRSVIARRRLCWHTSSGSARRARRRPGGSRELRCVW